MLKSPEKKEQISQARTADNEAGEGVMAVAKQGLGETLAIILCRIWWTGSGSGNKEAPIMGLSPEKYDIDVSRRTLGTRSGAAWGAKVTTGVSCPIMFKLVA